MQLRLRSTCREMFRCRRRPRRRAIEPSSFQTMREMTALHAIRTSSSARLLHDA
jgi:hypothetical protein